ncbi:2OG-Fe(II) oxygenase [Flavobacterium rhizosphaerae]|uniref:2OG-Fe(II) oxygenase n=1 Tax=Flavobacterium rhizosphaerae TaxID=3163298 RepID=A0ABW8YZL7_9FLAO
MDRQAYSKAIYNKLFENKEILKQQYNSSRNAIGYFFIDDLLPEELAQEIYTSFPKAAEMVLKKSLREDKYVAAQMNKYNPLLEEIIYAFQDAEIVTLVGEICGLKGIEPDEHLYAGGISMMGHKQFLNPHLDNSHNKDRQLWRVLNLLYYVTPHWQEPYGGNLELWPGGIKQKQITIHSKFNRLAVMATHNHSLHSVSPVTHQGYRCCISNYYFSQNPVHEDDTFHVTSFRGRPEDKVTDVLLQADTALRMGIRQVFKKGIVENPHVYRKEDGKEKNKD